MVVTEADCRQQTSPQWVGLRILVVENNVVATESTADLLSADGHRVQTTSDGLAALRAAQAGPPDVVIVDTHLPETETDGLQLAQQLWRLSSVRRPLLIALTEQGKKLDRDRSAEAGIHLHLLKPINRVFLTRVLRRFQSIIMPLEVSPRSVQHFRRYARLHLSTFDPGCAGDPCCF